VQFESVAPSHRPLPVSGKTGENLVSIPAQVVAYGYHGGVHEGDASAPLEGVEVQEEHHLEEHPAPQFHETVVGHRIREVTLEVDADRSAGSKAQSRPTLNDTVSAHRDCFGFLTEKSG